jgi:pimeloyl-ACP methyl ester carboxylesterase
LTSAATPEAGHVRYLLGGAFHTMAHTAWGPADGPVVVCVHGLTRNGRDFDALAQALAADGRRVICPDLPGRGASDWLPDGMLYQPPSYVTALAHLLATLGDRPIDWIGTSLGGICGMLIAAMPGQPIRRMVLNDIGPHIPVAALVRIRDYMSVADRLMTFDDLAALQRHLELVHAPFGALSQEDWAHLARHSARRLPDGKLALHYDPAITAPIRANEPQDVDMWPVWDRIDIPCLVIRGATSDLLLAETVARMEVSGAEAWVVPDAGHAPALMDAASAQRIASFLD